jgi:hypothetical protein
MLLNKDTRAVLKARCPAQRPGGPSTQTTAGFHAPEGSSPFHGHYPEGSLLSEPILPTHLQGVFLQQSQVTDPEPDHHS